MMTDSGKNAVYGLQLTGPGASPVIPLAKEAIRIGTMEGRVSLLTRDRSVSREHAEVVWDDEAQAYRLRDLGSRNGTYLAGKRIEEALLSDGDEFLCGRLPVKFVRVGPPLAAPVRMASAPLPSFATAPELKRFPPRLPAELSDYKDSVAETLRMRLDRSRAEADESAGRLRARVEKVVLDLLREFPPPASLSRDDVRKSILDDLLGYGPLQPYLEDEGITEIMVNREDVIFIERKGRLEFAGDVFNDRQQLMNVIERIVNQVNRKVNESSPLVDARLPDGSRVNVIIPPLALDGPCLTIRKFRKDGFTINDLVRLGAMSADMAEVMRICVENRMNILISGGTGSGKTTLLNVMASFIPSGERIVTIEDSAELRLPQTHVVRLETRPENMEGRGRVAIRDLVINSLRMRPDRIVVGECRGGEALDMVQAMNTGHDGSLTTAHANTPRDALRRLEVMCLMAGVDLPLRAIREQLASAIQLVVQVARFSDGSRKIVQISEITGLQNDVVSMQDLFRFKDEGLDATGARLGSHVPTGVIPSWADALKARGVKLELGMFKPPLIAREGAK